MIIKEIRIFELNKNKNTTNKICVLRLSYYKFYMIILEIKERPKINNLNFHLK